MASITHHPGQVRQERTLVTSNNELFSGRPGAWAATRPGMPQIYCKTDGDTLLPPLSPDLQFSRLTPPTPGPGHGLENHAVSYGSHQTHVAIYDRINHNEIKCEIQCLGGASRIASAHSPVLLETHVLGRGAARFLRVSCSRLGTFPAAQDSAVGAAP